MTLMEKIALGESGRPLVRIKEEGTFFGEIAEIRSTLPLGYGKVLYTLLPKRGGRLEIIDGQENPSRLEYLTPGED